MVALGSARTSCGGVTGSPGEGAGLSSLSGMGLSVVTWMGGLPILAHLAGAWSKDKMGMGLVVGSANMTGAMPTDWSTSVAQSNYIDWRVSLSFAARFVVFTSFATLLFTSLRLPFLFLCTLLCVLLLADLASPHALTSLALLTSRLMMFDSRHLDDRHCSSHCSGT